MRVPYATLLTLVGWATFALGSSGDRSTEFQFCLNHLKNQVCSTGHYPMPLALRLTRWTCEDDCKYECMHATTNRALAEGRPIEQYYGKWPFVRFAGMQEPASVLFSILNLLAHWRGASRIKSQVPESHPMRRYYLRWSLVSANAWVWSSVFHTRDLPITEKLDYFGAALAILYALYYTTLRIFHLYPISRVSRLTQTTRSRSTIHRALATICILAYIGHVSYLSLLPRFDYTYNMVFNLAVGLIHNAFWIIYGLPSAVSVIKRYPTQPKSYRPKFATSAVILVGFTTAATALELLDFPPWHATIDAHSLWHLVTVPIAVAWYEFLLQDSLDPSWRDQKA